MVNTSNQNQKSLKKVTFLFLLFGFRTRAKGVNHFFLFSESPPPNNILVLLYSVPNVAAAK
jgi:hypothetical protein